VREQCHKTEKVRSSETTTFVLRSLAHDLQCILATVGQFALVGIELLADFLRGCFGRPRRETKA
jgi:hypothetical protein